MCKIVTENLLDYFWWFRVIPPDYTESNNYEIFDINNFFNRASMIAQTYFSYFFKIYCCKWALRAECSGPSSTFSRTQFF